MYRIELSPGEVTVFRTIEELATGVRNGVISSRARIYHGATQKWLPIEFHPHYKAALALLSGEAPAVALPAAKPQERPSFEKLSFLQQPVVAARASSAASDPVSETAAEAVGDQASLEPAPTAAGPEPECIGAPATPAGTLEPSPIVTGLDLPESSTADSPIELGSSLPASPQLSAPVATSVESPRSRPLPERRDARGKQGQTDRHRAAAHAQAALPYLVPPDDTDEPLTFDRDYNAPPPPARPRPASVIERERPEPVVEEPALSPVAPGRGVPAAIAAIRASEAAAAEASGPAVLSSDTSRAASGASALPPVQTSPVADLPRIPYPEFTPADAPMAEPPSSGSRHRRPLQIALALGLLGVGGYGATWVFGPGHTMSAAQRPERVEAAAAQPVASLSGPAGASITTALPAKSQTSSAAHSGGPTAQDPMPPASSGFAPALEARAIVKPSPSDSARGTAGDSLPGVAPAPIDLSVPVPVVTDDSLLPNDRPQGDSTLRKILRAVSGGKELPARP